MKSRNKPPGSRRRELFLKALEKPTPAERQSFLDGTCGEDSALRASVEALLAHHQEDTFLEGPPAARSLTDAGMTLPAGNPQVELPGDSILRYRLLEKIGEGGFGAVYVAEQREPVKRRVALKIIKLGLDTRQVVARFEAERQALALMAELAGIGMSCGAYHITSAHPDGRGASQAMDQALLSASMDLGQIDYINAHGTGTQVNDPIETQAIKTTFGDLAYAIPISSIKSMIGHSIGASGALEAATCVNVINRGVIPPRLTWTIPTQRAISITCPTRRASRRSGRTAMSNSFAFGGQNCVLIFQRFD